MKIHKFILSETATNIKLPQGSEILTAQLQESNVVLWVKMTDDPFIETRTIIMLLTDGEFTETDMIYINTVQHNYFDYHIFEVIQ